MGWGNCGEDSRGRAIGYYHTATCDHAGCGEAIDRGLAYACGGMHGTGCLGGDARIDWSADFPSCEGYFCEQHLRAPDLEHEDGTEIWAPTYCPACSSEIERLYRIDPEYRDMWPTSAPPVPLPDRGLKPLVETEGLDAQHESPARQSPEPFPSPTQGDSHVDRTRSEHARRPEQGR